MKKILLFLIALVAVSCSNNSPEVKSNKLISEELVDIRIFQDGQIRFNGKMISETGLKSHIEALNTSKSTKVRIIFNETVPTRIVFNTMQLFQEKKIGNMHTKALNPEEFLTYNKYKIHVDILSANKILVQGDKMHQNSLPTALKNIEIYPETNFIVSVAENVKFGSVIDVQKALVAAK